MREKLLRLSFVGFLLITFETTASHAVDSILLQLDGTMSERHTYDKIRNKRLESLKDLISEFKGDLYSEGAYKVNKQIISEYWPFSFDSTFQYINQNLVIAESLNNSIFLNESRLQLSLLLASSGRYKEAEDILNQIETTGFDVKLFTDYYNCYRKIFSDLDYFSLHPDSRKNYGELYKSFTDSVLPLLPKESDELLYAREWQLLEEKKYNKCLSLNSQRLSSAEIGTEKYSYVTFQRSLIYEMLGDREMEKKYLALSAISDIKGARKDNASLAKLALMIYEEDNIERAYNYIKFSFEDAIFYNSKLRFIEIASSFSLILEAFQMHSNRQQRRLVGFTIAVSILSVGLLIIAYLNYRQRMNLVSVKNELHEANNRYKEINETLESTLHKLKNSYGNLAEANRVKELYIGSFMKICSDFIDKLDKYRLMVNRMVAARSYQKLFDLTKNFDAIEQEVATFYETFDKTFLNLYPSFVQDFNDLLIDEEKIDLKKEEALNAELRIFALIRLGIDDSTKIAQLLRYSVQTIYNYRVKIKNKAKGPREEFEEQLLRIGAFDTPILDSPLPQS